MVGGASGKSFDDGRRRRVNEWERWRQEARHGGVLTIAGGDKSVGGSSVPIWFFFFFFFFTLFFFSFLFSSGFKRIFERQQTKSFLVSCCEH
jgi:hypothetical protein